MLSADIKDISILHGKDEKVLLSGMSFVLADSSINIILGKNGTGKSTLIRALTGLLNKNFYKVSGKVEYNGSDLLTLPESELLKIRRSKIGYVFQDAINSLDPLKNINFYFKRFKNEPEADALLNGFLLPGRADLFRLYPYELSGGMAQRLLLILTLLRHPQILILDEPTSGIDTPISNLILLKLKEFVNDTGKSVLLVTQDLQFAANAGDRIAYLADGKLSDFYSNEMFFNDIPIPGLKNFLLAYNQLI